MSCVGLNKDVLSIDEIEDYIISEFGNEFFNSSVDYTKIHGAFEWYADQSLFGYKIDQWLKKFVKIFYKKLLVMSTSLLQHSMS